MASVNEQLFLDRFIEYNKHRYADNPSFVAKLDQLDIANVTFGDFQRTENTPGEVLYTVDISSPKLFNGAEQSYKPASYISDKASTVVEEEPLTLEELRKRVVPGIYKLLDGENVVGAVLVLNGEKTTEMVLNLVQDSARFDIDEVGIIIDAQVASVDIESHTIVGRLTVVEGLFDQFPRYNGQYRCDGSVSAL